MLGGWGAFDSLCQNSHFFLLPEFNPKQLLFYNGALLCQIIKRGVLFEMFWGWTVWHRVKLTVFHHAIWVCVYEFTFLVLLLIWKPTTNYSKLMWFQIVCIPGYWWILEGVSILHKSLWSCVCVSEWEQILCRWTKLSHRGNNGAWFPKTALSNNDTFDHWFTTWSWIDQVTVTDTSCATGTQLGSLNSDYWELKLINIYHEDFSSSFFHDRKLVLALVYTASC